MTAPAAAKRPATVLAVSGSLRAASSNTNLLRAAALVAPPYITVSLFAGLGSLPLFNPDLDHEDEPLPSVEEWRALLRTADAVLISTPEYAHGVPGALKNALDWVVGSGELVGKPVGLVNAFPRSTHAQASLVETLTVMSAVLPPDAVVAVPPECKRLDPKGMASAPEIAGPFQQALDALVRVRDACCPNR
ncbi:fmn reductase : NADPH-dependent FMN reductase OS=Gloeobacter kilaueensis JS1 GN=GKIL_3076 PE=4 SV=1: FMN_red [Gemmata massiliana]|uniref:NADPH-dependent FMN reductase-like domain-containing protein n=1 Tax=Gemmata massiliana TaxID=1210884 RepID=A0A6P2D0M2_9BACT|nr:NAD(P)H-dependent oxidoreductase [Gemmata massiliana]VTR94663.1 fmn reductase : NADPH-dependent FMN reductase OS=Gloeobacter kilaueensis JS1 GN=GKIL_3076 PE=4 SV=1: FMN_red [Gemmata massiliana]